MEYKLTGTDITLQLTRTVAGVTASAFENSAIPWGLNYGAVMKTVSPKLMLISILTNKNNISHTNLLNFTSIPDNIRPGTTSLVFMLRPCLIVLVVIDIMMVGRIMIILRRSLDDWHCAHTRGR